MLSLIRNVKRKILKPSVTQFAINYVALDSLLESKAAPCQMFVSIEWQKSRFTRAVNKRSITENLVTRQIF